MILMGKKVKAKSLPLPLGDIAYPEPLDPEIQVSIVQRILLGQESKEDRESLFKGHIRLAINIAGRYAYQNRGRDADLVSEALLSLWRCILEAGEKLKDTNFTPWCISRMHSDVYTYLTKDSLVPIPISTLTRKNREGQKMEFVSCYSIYNISTEKQIDPEEMVETKYMRHRRQTSLEVGNNQTFIEINDMVEKSIKTETEKRVIGYRSRGFNDQEIALKMNRSVAYISKVKRTVEERYEKLERCK